MLGVQGGRIGTRFYAIEEAPGHRQAKHRIAKASGDETRRTRVFDIDTAVVWSGKGIDLIRRVESAASIVRRISDQAQLRAIASASTPRFQYPAT